MELRGYSEDLLDRLLVQAESEIGSWRLVEMAVVDEKRRQKSHLEDGYRSIIDWTAARADVSHDTARAICWTASRLYQAPEVASQLASVRSALTGRNNWPGSPKITVPVIKVMTSPSCVVWSLITGDSPRKRPTCVGSMR